MSNSIKNIIKDMTLEEKASLCSGADFWHTKAVERLGVPAIMVSDGPHGLRKQAEEADHLGINDSISAVCFPAACATAASFDVERTNTDGTAKSSSSFPPHTSSIFFVKVSARILSGSHPCSRILAILHVSTLVFPEPAPATISTGPSTQATAFFCSLFSPSKIAFTLFSIITAKLLKNTYLRTAFCKYSN